MALGIYLRDPKQERSAKAPEKELEREQSRMRMSVKTGRKNDGPNSKLPFDCVTGEKKGQFSLERDRFDLRLVLAATELVLAKDDGAGVERRWIVGIVGLEKARIKDDVGYKIEGFPLIGVYNKKQGNQKCFFFKFFKIAIFCTTIILQT